MPESNQIKAVIIDGFSNHDWQRNTVFLVEFLSNAGISVDVSTVPDDETSPEWHKWNPRFGNYDVVIQTCTDICNKKHWPEPIQISLESYISEGGCMLVYHAGNNAFPDWKEYNLMIGLGWRNKDFGKAVIINNDETCVFIPEGEGESTSHGARVDAVITRLNDHPIHKGLPRQWKASDIEIYRYARGPAENLTILSYAKDKETGINFPIEWTVRYGKGHVYTSTLGHLWHDQKDLPPGIRCAGFRTILIRTVTWLAGRSKYGTQYKPKP